MMDSEEEMNLIVGKNSVIEAIKSDRKIETLYIKSGDFDEKTKYILKLIEGKNIPTKIVDKKKLDSIVKGGNHQGVALKVPDYKYYEFDKLLDDIKTNKENHIKSTVVVLDKVEDVHNLGSIIRSCEGGGVDAVIIQKTNAATVNPTVEKTSSGATSYMNIVKVTNITQAIQKLKAVGMWVYAVDMGEKVYYQEDFSTDVVLVIGSEGKGVSRLVKENCDFTISIPMKGKIESLNASVAASIVIYEVMRQRETKNGKI